MYTIFCAIVSALCKSLPAILQVLNLLRGRHSAQSLIAMRISSKPLNDNLVSPLNVQIRAQEHVQCFALARKDSITPFLVLV